MSAKRALFYGLLCWLAYVSLRTHLQRLLPFHDWPSFIPQDLAITALRLACGFSCLWIARRRWNDSALGLGPGASVSALALWAIFACLLGEIFGAFSQRPDWSQPLWIRIVEVAVALAVAFNEEVGFRALTYSGLRELWGRRIALLASSLLFTLMHFGYQPAFHLPKIFILGLFFGCLRDRGVSLKTLILVHFFIDSFYAALLAGVLDSQTLYWTSTGLVALAALLSLLAPQRHSAEGGSLLFVYGSLRQGELSALELGVERRCDLVGRGQVRGKLGKRGGFPALLPSRKKDEQVPGELLQLRDSEYLKELDIYEGDDYLRDRMEIKMESGKTCEAWIYCAKK